MNTIKKPMFAFLAMTALASQPTAARKTYNFNMGWTIDNQKHVTLPHAWNEDEAYKVRCNELSEGVRWYRKHFTTPKLRNGERVIVEFEGAKQAEWRGGVATGREDNYAGDKTLPLEAGVHRVLLRSTTKAGDVKLTLEADGLPTAQVALRTQSVDGSEGNALTGKKGEGLSTYFPSDGLECDLTRGETPTKDSRIFVL